MTGTELFFIDVLSSHISGKAPSAPDSVDPGALISLANIHKLTPILYYELTKNCKGALPEDCLAWIKRNAYMQITSQISKSKAFVEAYGKLSDAGIRGIVVKGITLRALYPEPDLRLSIEGVALKEGVDYELTYGWDTRDNISPENDAAVVIRGIGFYKGYSVKFYDIQKAKLTVTAKSYRIANSEKEENIPVFKNIVEGLLANHKISYNNEPQISSGSCNNGRCSQLHRRYMCCD